MGINVTDVGLQKKSAEPELKKHSATIHCSNSLSLLQRKISNALLYHAYKELLLKEEHEITIKQLCKLISYNGNNHSVIKDALKGLLSTIIEWNVVSDTTGQEDWTASSILASVSLQGPICLFAYSPRMKQLLHSPTMFGKINLFIQSRFKSSYGLALYENCIRYRGLPYTKWFEMDMFRKLMGVPEDKYTIFRDFKRRVLDKSVEEVNTYSDLVIEPEIFKEGRQVVKVRFCLKERAKKTRLGANANEEGADVETSLKTKLSSEFGFSIEQVEEVMTEYSAQFITEKLDLIEASKNYQQGKIHNLAGYVISALKNNYQPGRTSATTVAEKSMHNYKLQLQTKEIQRLADEVRDAYQIYREQVIDRELLALNENEKDQFMEHFHRHADEAITTILRLQRNKYTRTTVLKSPQIKVLLRQFALQEFPYILEQMVPLEKFVQNFSEKHQQAWQQAKLENADVV